MQVFTSLLKFSQIISLTILSILQPAFVSMLFFKKERLKISILLRKSMDWFLYDNGLRHKIVKIYFLLFSIFDVLRTYEALQIFFYKFLLKWGKLKKILSPAYFLKLKNIILFLNWGLTFFWNGHIRNVVSTLPNVVKIDVENDNVVSTLSNVVQFNVEIHNVFSTLIWRCATSRRHINLKSTLNRLWNVCWGLSKYFLLSHFYWLQLDSTRPKFGCLK